MSYEKGEFAFFEGTSSDYKKAVKTNDTIGYKVESITPDSVKLAQNTNVLQLAVGAQLHRQTTDVGALRHVRDLCSSSVWDNDVLQRHFRGG